MSTIADFFSVILAGESKTYNDHNWYTCPSISCIKGFIEGRSSRPYSLLKKPLSQYTIGEVKEFQAHPRSGAGQLWATGRYQMIPTTLAGMQKITGLPDSAIYNQANQDKMALGLLNNNSSIKNYISGTAEDNATSLQKAAIGVAKIWSSVGVPYDMQGHHNWVTKGQSYYHRASGGGDRASVSSETAQAALKLLRKGLGGVIVDTVVETAENIKETVNKYPKIFFFGSLFVAGSIFGLIYYYKKKGK
jgi:muramidase (phage lysozyme)